MHPSKELSPNLTRYQEHAAQETLALVFKQLNSGREPEAMATIQRFLNQMPEGSESFLWAALGNNNDAHVWQMVYTAVATKEFLMASPIKWDSATLPEPPEADPEQTFEVAAIPILRLLDAQEAATARRQSQTEPIVLSPLPPMRDITSSAYNRVIDGNQPQNILEPDFQLGALPVADSEEAAVGD